MMLMLEWLNIANDYVEIKSLRCCCNIAGYHLGVNLNRHDDFVQVIDIVTLGKGPSGGGFLPNGLIVYFSASGAGSQLSS